MDVGIGVDCGCDCGCDCAEDAFATDVDADADVDAGSDAGADIEGPSARTYKGKTKLALSNLRRCVFTSLKTNRNRFKARCDQERGRRRRRKSCRGNREWDLVESGGSWRVEVWVDI